MRPPLFLFLILLSLSLHAQNRSANDGDLVFHIKKTTGKIIIDGKIDEADWQIAAIADHFKQNYPFDSSYAGMQTIARATFDDQYLYVSAICYQPNK